MGKNTQSPTHCLVYMPAYPHFALLEAITSREHKANDMAVITYYHAILSVHISLPAPILPVGLCHPTIMCVHTSHPQGGTAHSTAVGQAPCSPSHEAPAVSPAQSFFFVPSSFGSHEPGLPPPPPPSPAAGKVCEGMESKARGTAPTAHRKNCPLTLDVCTAPVLRTTRAEKINLTCSYS